MHRFLLACSLLLCACTDDASPTGTLEFGATCTTASNTSTECASGVCTNSFDMLGHSVCSQLCTFGMNDTCPAGTTGTKMCNMKGFCKP
jgi:hypothetical protein